MHDRFRRQQQHRDRRDRERTEGHGGPVDQHREQHDSDHVITALRRDFRAGEQQIERGRREREKRSPFLDRMPARQSRDQRQQRADDEEHHARDHRHVIAGDRQHVGEARNVHRVVDRPGDRVAGSGQERRGDRCLVARQRRADMLVDAVAHPLDERGVAHPERRARFRLARLDVAADEAGGADALEIQVAGEIVAAGFERRERRIEPRLELDELADSRRRALAHGEANAAERFCEPPAFDRVDTDHDAVGALAGLARFDPAGDCCAGNEMAQHRMADPLGPDRRGGKARRGGGKSQNDRNPDRFCAQRDRGAGERS
jgi:hypothetical protein